MPGIRSNSPRVLIADDQADVIHSLQLLLKSEDYEITTADTPARVLERARRLDLDVILMDMNYARDTTSGREGLDLLTQLLAVDGSLRVVVMTAWGTIDLAVEAMRRGARDFIQKPWENERLLTVLKSQIELRRALRQGRRLEEENRVLRSRQQVRLITQSPVMQPVLDLIARVGPSDAHVLITGEHGTGKEVVARSLHSVSARSAKPLVAVNLGGLSEGVFVSEMFGHVKGAFTDARSDRIGRFELADGGTLLLDEVTSIPVSQQANLLRVLESGEMQRVGSSRTKHVDVRVLSATNADLKREVERGRFREDLLFRLNTVEIRIPPLRDRDEDILLLANHFLGRYNQKYRKRLDGFSEPALAALAHYSWPGNVRELKHVVERSVLLARESSISVEDLSLPADSPFSNPLEMMTLEEAEGILIGKALARTGGNVSRAARSLGMSRTALYRRMEKLGL